MIKIFGKDSTEVSKGIIKNKLILINLGQVLRFTSICQSVYRISKLFLRETITCWHSKGSLIDKTIC